MHLLKFWHAILLTSKIAFTKKGTSSWSELANRWKYFVKTILSPKSSHFQIVYDAVWLENLFLVFKEILSNVSQNLLHFWIFKLYLLFFSSSYSAVPPFDTVTWSCHLQMCGAVFTAMLGCKWFKSHRPGIPGTAFQLIQE